VYSLKICFISPSYFPTLGGTEVAIYELGKRLVNKGCEVILVTPSSDGNIEDDSGMIIHRIPIPLEMFVLSPTHYYGRLFPPPITSTYALIKILKSNKFKKIDLLHQFHVFYLGNASIFAKKLLGKPLITNLMGWDTYDPIHPLPKFLHPYLTYIINNSDTIISPAHCLLSYIRSNYRKKVKIIPHGVDIRRFNVKNENNYRKKLGMKKEEILVLSVQRLVLKKGIKYLLYAMSMVVKEDPNVKLVIIGEGPEKPQLIKLIKKMKITKNVKIAGFVGSEVLPKYYSACDIFVLHSLYEQFGIVLLEAMACGKPVVSTKVGAIPEIVENGKTGFLVDLKNPKQLSEAILKLASDENLRNKLGKEGRKKVEKKYDWDIITDRYLNEYWRLIYNK